MNKVNEAIYRSPKFLRKFMDFEINTKGDIKGEPSEKEKKRRIWEMWDDRWRSCDVDIVTGKQIGRAHV